MTVTSREFTWDEIRQHRSEKSLWLVIRNTVYDVTDFVSKHPGGTHTLVTAAGQDVTYLMETSHPFTTKPWDILPKYKIGTVSVGFVEYTEEQPFYDTVKARVKEYFARTKLDEKDPIPGLKVFAFLCATWALGYTGLCYSWMLGAVLLGATRALLGIHTMHLSSHFAISHSPFVWRWLDWFCFDVLMGGCSMAWNFQHVVGHHQHTNVFEADPDLPVVVDGDIRRVTKFQRWKIPYQYQAFYLPILYMFLALKTRYTDALILMGNYMNGNIHMNVTRLDYVLLVATKIFFVFYQLVVPYVVFQLPLSRVLALYLVAELVTGTWLAYFFQVNHISDHVLFTSRANTNVKEWAMLQVEGTVEYSHDSPLFAFLSGTLNYQAVHHLFPSVATHHYPAIAKILMQACKEYDVNYQVLPSFWQACLHHLKELHRMGNKAE